MCQTLVYVRGPPVSSILMLTLIQVGIKSIGAVDRHQQLVTVEFEFQTSVLMGPLVADL